MGAGGGMPVVGDAIKAFGGERARKGAKRGYSQARGEFKTQPAFTQGGLANTEFFTKNAPLFQNIASLLAGGGAQELEPALRSADLAGRNQQLAFKSALGRSGLAGSGFDLGGNQAIANQTAVNKQNILAGLPALKRANLGAISPYFEMALGDIARMQGGRAGVGERSAAANAAGKAATSNMEGNMVGGINTGGKNK